MGRVIPSGLGQIFQNVIKKATGIYGTVLQISSTLSGIKFGTSNEIYQDANGHLVIVNPTTSKNIFIDAKTNIQQYISGAIKSRLDTDLFYHYTNCGHFYGKYSSYYNTDNTKFGYIKNSGGNGVEGPIDFFNCNATQLVVMRLLAGGVSLPYSVYHGFRVIDNLNDAPGPTDTMIIMINNAAKTITLPTAGMITGRKLVIRSISAINALTIATEGAEKILELDAIGVDTIALADDQFVELSTNGINWYVMSKGTVTA